MSRVHLILLALVAASSVRLVAQAPAPATPEATSPPQTPAQAAPPAPTPPPDYAYTIDGRRDPFLALISPRGQQRGSTRPATVRAEGLGGLVTDEVVVRGIVQSRGTWVAMVSGPSGRVYTVRLGDRLADGAIKEITPQAIVIVQQVNDPLSLEKQREVRKYLRGGENK